MKKQDDQIFGTNAGLFDPFPVQKPEEDKQHTARGLGKDAGLFEANEKTDRE